MAIFNSFLYVYQRVSHEIPISSGLERDSRLLQPSRLPLQQCANHITLATKGKSIFESLGSRITAGTGFQWFNMHRI